MSSVGSYLRELRERRGVSLDEISRSTRVLRGYLEALEADDIAALPAPAFTRGFIRAYCQALGEPPDEALARYEGRRPEGAPDHPAQAHLAPAPEGRPRREASTRADNRGRGAVLVSFVLLVVLGAALFTVTLVLQPAGERRSEPRPPAPLMERSPGPPPTPAASAAAPSPPVSALTAPGRPVPQATPARPPVAVTGVASPYRLIARTTEATWIRVRTEDGRASEETIPPGEIREWVSNRPFVLTIGNAGGVTLELNGHRLPPLGPSGGVIARLVLPSEGQ